MKLNPSKTKEIRVSNFALATNLPPITIDGHAIDIFPRVKLLETIISEDLKLTRHVEYICKKAGKRLYTLRLLKRSSIPPDRLIRVFTTCMRPILEYSCEVWHSCLPQYLSDKGESVLEIHACSNPRLSIQGIQNSFVFCNNGNIFKNTVKLALYFRLY